MPLCLVGTLAIYRVHRYPTGNHFMDLNLPLHPRCRWLNLLGHRLASGCSWLSAMNRSFIVTRYGFVNDYLQICMLDTCEYLPETVLGEAQISTS